MANNFTPQELGVKRTTIRFRENLISPQPNYQKSIDKQGTLQKMTSLCFAARIKHGNTSSTNVTFPVPNKWSVQTRTKKNITKQSQVTSFVQFRTLHTPNFLDQSLSETPGFSENSATGSQSACQISMFFQRMHVIRSSTFALWLGHINFTERKKNKQVEIEIVWNCMKLFCPCWYHRYLFLGSKYTTPFTALSSETPQCTVLPRMQQRKRDW